MLDDATIAISSLSTWLRCFLIPPGTHLPDYRADFEPVITVISFILFQSALRRSIAPPKFQCHAFSSFCFLFHLRLIMSCRCFRSRWGHAKHFIGFKAIALSKYILLSAWLFRFLGFRFLSVGFAIT